MTTSLFIKHSTATLLLLIYMASWKSNGYAQLPIGKIDFGRVPQRKVRKLVEKQQKDGIMYFSDLKPLCSSKQDAQRYSFHETSHVIKEKIQNVWSKLKRIKPKDEYSGKMVSFGFLYSKQLNRIFYGDDEFQEIEEGQVFYLNLKLLGGIKNIGVALEVTKVDEANKVIQLCYLENGLSEGTQQIKLTENEEGYTVISQETTYKNRSKFREKRLYPLFHQKAVNELHQNIRNIIEGFPNASN